MSSCQCVIMSTCHHVIMSMCQCVNVSSCHHVIMSMCQCVIMSSCQCVIMSMCHHVIMSMCQHVIMSSCQCVNVFRLFQLRLSLFNTIHLLYNLIVVNLNYCACPSLINNIIYHFTACWRPNLCLHNQANSLCDAIAVEFFSRINRTKQI